jgi:hypothetical protein
LFARLLSDGARTKYLVVDIRARLRGGLPYVTMRGTVTRCDFVMVMKWRGNTPPECEAGRRTWNLGFVPRGAGFAHSGRAD